MEKIKEIIEQARYTDVDLKNNCIGIRLIVDEGSFYMHTKSELLHLLSVAEKQKDAIIYQLPFGVAKDRAKNTPLITEQLKEKPEQLPCDDTVCKLPHKRVYRGCDECVYNKTN